MKVMFGASAIAACLLVAVLPAAIVAAARAPSIDGKYITQGGFVEVTIAPCRSSAGSARCGTITRILKRKAGESNVDTHNDNPALRKRPIKGITLLTGLRFEGNAWRGNVYNPEDGGTYRAEVRPQSGGGIQVKGCFVFICKGRIWARVS